jgi:hypothetical protein
LRLAAFLQKQVPELNITPVTKVVDRHKKAAVGFLLLNRMYLPVAPEPIQNIHDSLKTVESVDYLEAEIAIYSNKKDEERLKARLYSLEDNFYRVFQFEVRTRINSPEYVEKRNELLSIVNKNNHEDHESNIRKRKRITSLLQNLMKGIITFQDIDPKIYETTDHIGTCSSDSHKKDAKNSLYCFESADGVRRVFFPKKNLLEPVRNNEEAYYIRLADELVRNPRIRNLVLQPSYLFIRDSNMGELKKNSSEMVVFDSELTKILKREERPDHRTTNREYYSKNVFGNTEPSKRAL